MRIALLLGLLPAIAFGQSSITLTLGAGGQTDVFKNGGQCNDHLAVNWTGNVSGVACAPFEVFATVKSSCPDKPDTDSGDFTIGTEDDLSKGSGTFDFVISNLPIFDGGTCGGEVDKTVNICGTFSVGQIDCGGVTPAQVVKASPVPTIRFDSIPPPAPVVTEVNTLDGALGVRVNPGNDTSTVTVQYREQGGGNFISVSPYSAQIGGTTIDGLTNGTTYEVRATVSDQANNDSEPSAVKTGTPARTDGFWAAYVNDGGQETGGCSVAGPSSLALLLIAAAFGRARRKS
jgi:hypothetical protein